MKKVIDCFMFFNEYDILEGRLEYLYNHVDYFVLVESNLTQSGHDKPMNFANNLHRYKKYMDKILYFPYLVNRSDFNYDKLPTYETDYNTGPWQLENGQRNHIIQALKLFNDDDIVLISDLDEIPHKNCIGIAKDYFSKGWDRLAVEQDFYLYNFKRKLVRKWRGTTISTNKVAKEVTPQGLRNNLWNIGLITNGGWHLSYWNSIENIQYKIETFAHQELNQDRFRDPEHIKQKILSGQDMFDRDNPVITVDPTVTIPADVLEIFGKFEEELYKQL